ncbi:MAG: carbohydrate-binding domain-containing protein, partial [Rhodoglobus sp.]|nr:carbohydrate-binding domain-containing protein [Rhodoglobus sp.]
MKNSKFTLTAVASSLFIGGLLLAGCSATVATTTSAPDSAAVVALDTGVVATEVLAANANSTTVNDDEWTSDGSVAITLEGSTASADGEGVVVDGATVTITAVGTYVLTGQLTGQVVVDTAEEGVVALVLDGAQITSSTS